MGARSNLPRLPINLHFDAVTHSPHNHDHDEATSEDVKPSDKHHHPHPHTNKRHDHGYSPEEAAVLRLERIIQFLEAHFGDVQMYEPKPVLETEVEPEGDTEMTEEGDSEPLAADEPAIIVKLDDNEARINLIRMASLTIHSCFYRTHSSNIRVNRLCTVTLSR